MAVKLEATYDSNTPPEVLAKLAKDKNEYVRIGVAWSKNTPPEVLAE